MAKIKSAWEIALERTENVEADHKAVAAEKARNSGMRLASRAMEPGDTLDLKKELSAFSAEERKLVVTAYASTLMSNLALPETKLFEDRLKGLKRGLEAVYPDQQKLEAIFTQLGQFLGQWIDNRETLRDRLIEQYTPKLQEKARRLAQQTGQRISLAPEQDPEFINLLQDNLGQLRSQYQGALDELKAEMRADLGLE